VVTLPYFTANNLQQKSLFLNIFLFLLIPRWYEIGRKESISSFSRMIQYENNDDIYDNPQLKRLLIFVDQKQKPFFLSLFCFGLVSWTYLDHNTIQIRMFYLH
jgi:hypothetical protein